MASRTLVLPAPFGPKNQFMPGAGDNSSGSRLRTPRIESRSRLKETRYSFNGMTTWRTASLSGSVTRQELLASLSEMATFSPSIEPSASSR